jgi:hypothetical protein
VSSFEDAQAIADHAKRARQRVPGAAWSSSVLRSRTLVGRWMVWIRRPKLNAEMLRRQSPILSPEEDQALMRKAGIRDIHAFYASFALRGWVARA